MFHFVSRIRVRRPGSREGAVARRVLLDGHGHHRTVDAGTRPTRKRITRPLRVGQREALVEVRVGSRVLRSACQHAATQVVLDLERSRHHAARRIGCILRVLLVDALFVILGIKHLVERAAGDEINFVLAVNSRFPVILGVERAARHGERYSGKIVRRVLFRIALIKRCVARDRTVRNGHADRMLCHMLGNGDAGADGCGAIGIWIHVERRGRPRNERFARNAQHAGAHLNTCSARDGTAQDVQLSFLRVEDSEPRSPSVDRSRGMDVDDRTTLAFTPVSGDGRSIFGRDAHRAVKIKRRPFAAHVNAVRFRFAVSGENAVLFHDKMRPFAETRILRKICRLRLAVKVGRSGDHIQILVDNRALIKIRRFPLQTFYGAVLDRQDRVPAIRGRLIHDIV